MIHVIISAVLVIACAILSAGVVSCVRSVRLAQQGQILSDVVSGESHNKTFTQRPTREEPRLPSWMNREFFFVRPLKAAGITLHPFYFVLAVAGVSAPLGMGVALLSGQGIVGVIALLLAWLGVVVGVRLRIRKRQDLLDAQLAQALPQITASVRSSLTFERALRVVVVHLQDPLRSEFIKVLSDVAYGTPLYEALEAMAGRTNSSDIKTLAAATKVRQGSGGSIVSALSMVSLRVNARLKAARELRVEVASTRMAKWVVALAMPAIFALMFTTNADFAQFYTSEPLGWIMLGIAAGMEAIGLLMSHSITALCKRRSNINS